MLGSIFNRLLQLLFIWRYTAPTPLIPHYDDSEWVLVPSNNEDSLNQRRKDQTRSELLNLRERSFISVVRIQMVEIVRKEVSAYPPERLTLLTETPLEPDSRMRIIKDILTELSSGWLSKLKSDIKERWYPTQYQHNIMGELISLFVMATPDKFTIAGLSQALIALNLSLLQVITVEEDRKEIPLLIQSSVSKIIDLWIDTAQKSKACKKGVVVSKWKQQEQQKKQVKQEIAATYSSGSDDPLRRSYMEKTEERPALIDNFKDRRSFLEGSLKLV